MNYSSTEILNKLSDEIWRYLLKIKQLDICFEFLCEVEPYVNDTVIYYKISFPNKY